jgi:hypothetical protein
MEKINGFKTFKEFLELVEGKKKEIKKLKSAYLAGQELAPRQIVNYGDSAPNSPERAAQIAAMMRDSGGGAVKKAIKQREKQAEKVAKRVLNKEGFSIKTTQKELEEKRRKEKEREMKKMQQRTNDARFAFRHGEGMISYEKGPDGKVVRGRRTKDGKFTPDT